MERGRFNSTAFVLRFASTKVLRTIGVARNVVGGTRQSRNAHFDVVRNSSLFDRHWYVQTYPDVAKAGVDPLTHYMTVGWREGRDPGPDFATNAYLKANADVARSGANPLYHYLEFGHSEGRGSPSHRTPLKPAPVAPSHFGDPSECLSFPVAQETPTWWRDAADLDTSLPGALEIGGRIVGYTGADPMRASIRAHFGALQKLSGLTLQNKPEMAGHPDVSEEAIDAWFANVSLFRTRWDAKAFPFVIRAYQANPATDGLDLVGEGLISSPLDLFDAHLGNRYFPILFVLADPDGTLRGSRLLAFPSLSRGGAHFAESLDRARRLNGGKALALPESQGLAAVLLSDSAKSLSGRLVVDDADADGLGPVFQSDFRLWLEKVMRVDLTMRSEEALPPADAEATLQIRHDCIPTIAALVEIRNAKAHEGRALLPVIVEKDGHSTLLDPPRELASVLDGISLPGSSVWPWTNFDARADFPTAAICSTRRTIDDAELLAPFAPDAANVFRGQRDPVTWMVDASDQPVGGLIRSIEALALQDGSDADAILLLGRVPRAVLSAARRVFPHARVLTDRNTVRSALETPLAAYVGNGLVLHDGRTATALAQLLKSDRVATASCILLSIEQSGGAWHPNVAETGELLTGHEISRGFSSRLAELLWREVYSVAAPPSDFWMARSSQLPPGPVGSAIPRLPQAFNLCSSMVTATYAQARERRRIALPSTAAANGLATQVRVLAG